MAENKFEWLHRLNTTHGLLIALFGGPAVTAATQAIIAAFSLHTLPWFGSLAVAAIFSLLIVLVVLSSRRVTPSATNQIVVGQDHIRLQSEAERISQHRVDLLGTQIVDLKAQLEKQKEIAEACTREMNAAFDKINKNSERENHTISELVKAKEKIAQFEKQESRDPSGGLLAAFSEIDAANKVPQLLIEYKPAISGKTEYLVFINDGPVALQQIRVGPIVCRCELTREINLHNVVGPIRAKKDADCKFAVFERHGESQIILELSEMLKQMKRAMESSGTADTTVRVTYGDLEGRRYSRVFSLSMDGISDRVAWNPGPVRLEPSSASGEL